MSAPIISKGKFASDQQMGGPLMGQNIILDGEERLDEEEDVGRFCEKEGDGI